jgi:hypothetical protein
MAPPPSGDSSSGASTVAAATKLRDEALAAAKALEEEVVSLDSSNTERSKQLKEEADLLQAVAAAQEHVGAAVDALAQERTRADTLEQKDAALRTCLHPSDPDDADSQDDDDDHSTFSNAATVARLHNQAVVV